LKIVEVWQHFVDLKAASARLALSSVRFGPKYGPSTQKTSVTLDRVQSETFPGGLLGYFGGLWQSCGALSAPVKKGTCLQVLWATWNEFGQALHLRASDPLG